MIIKCAKCQKPVKAWESNYCVDTMQHQIIVWCHGESDVCQLDASFLQEAHGPLPDGVAFQTKRIAA